MNVAGSEACLIDANIIFYIHDIEKIEGFPDIIEGVYQQVVIHEAVYKELGASGKAFVDEKINAGLWEMFDENKLSSTQRIDYRNSIHDIESKLSEIDKKRGKPGSSGIGEINALAAASAIHAEFICSNDYSIQEVITELGLVIYPGGDDELEPRLLVQHRFLGLCARVCDKGILRRSQVLKGFKIAMRKSGVSKSNLEELINEFNELIPDPDK